MNKPVRPAPEGWNKTIGDLYDELKRGERTSVGAPETEWARAYERSQMPAGIRFPRGGDVYEALEDVPVEYLTHWRAPFTDGGKGTLPRGDRVIIEANAFDMEPIAVYASPADYEGVEQRMIPAADRRDPKYDGYHLSLRTVDLNRRFRLVPEERS